MERISCRERSNWRAVAGEPAFQIRMRPTLLLGHDLINFRMVDIPLGSTLTFSKDPEAHCTVVDHKSVEFDGEVTSLSASALAIVRRMGYDMSEPC